MHDMHVWFAYYDKINNYIINVIIATIYDCFLWMKEELPDGEESSVMSKCIEMLAVIGSFLLIMVTMPFSLCVIFKVVQEYERAVVFRMGRLKGGPQGPGNYDSEY